jgi:hypothetical protein
MPTDKRTKIATTAIADGVCEMRCWSDPAQGEQRVTDTLRYDMRDIPAPMLHDLAAYGFAAVAGNRYQREQAHPDVPLVANTLFAELQAGDWRPGKRDTGEGSEPTDLMLAIAEATSQPVHLVQERFETEMVKLNDGTLYRDSLGKPRRFFSAAVQRQLAADPAIAPILARLTQERAHRMLASAQAAGTDAPSTLSSLFRQPQPQQADAA